mmetsp:Transcript_59705/g.176920  ORF Transcript_59705/g.176920 Transcript_59705/m.176920 type:complete len:235 (+) Transcript_59705:542-1246(+)
MHEGGVATIITVRAGLSVSPPTSCVGLSKLCRWRGGGKSISTVVCLVGQSEPLAVGRVAPGDDLAIASAAVASSEGPAPPALAPCSWSGREPCLDTIDIVMLLGGWRSGRHWSVQTGHGGEVEVPPKGGGWDVTTGGRARNCVDARVQGIRHWHVGMDCPRDIRMNLILVWGGNSARRHSLGSLVVHLWCDGGHVGPRALRSGRRLRRSTLRGVGLGSWRTTARTLLLWLSLLR